jgi:6-phospho-beta-glucosidase
MREEPLEQRDFHLTQPPSQRVKITIIGDGSPYSIYLLMDMVKRVSQLKGCHVVLMDSDEERLQLIYKIGEKLFQYADVDLTLEATTNEEEAISDSSFIISAFRIGGLQARHLDETLPLRYGIIGHETIGPGGFFAALRSAHVAASIAASIEKLAPRAFLLNYTDPNNIVTEAISQANGIRVIGVRKDLPQYIPHIAEMAGFSPLKDKRFYTRTIGLNHGNWTTAIWCDGIDILPEIVSWSKKYIADAPETTSENLIHILRTRLTALYGALPSLHMPYYYFPEQTQEYERQNFHHRAEYLMIERPAQLKRLYEELQKGPISLENLESREDYNDNALKVICAIIHDTGDELVLNVPNRGALKFLAEDRVVELPCRVDARGATPLTQGDGGLALDQRGLIVQLAEYAGATAQAALWGTRLDAIKALAANPLVMAYSRAEALYEDMAAAHADYLPERLLY